VRIRILSLCLLAFVVSPWPAAADIFGTVHGLVHDPQHRPVPGATVALAAQHSEWKQTATTDAKGEFQFPAVPLGDYLVTVTLDGFQTATQAVTVVSGSTPVLHVALELTGITQTVTVSGTPDVARGESVTPTTLISRSDIAATPGAGRTNGLEAITAYVPGSYVTHDQLHVRGGHQVSWLIDGVPVPNTNIASNVGPQIDPKDIDYLEALRGSYDADYGDRTYAVFNVLPRSGFERNREAEVVVTAGSFYQTNDQFSLGDHTERFAYYASVTANRSNLGLQTPVPEIIHDRQAGVGGFGSLIFNRTPQNQMRLVVSARGDHYQIPIASGDQTADEQHESDAFINLSWVRTFASGGVLTISPFYHYTRANYEGDPGDFPIATTDRHASRYAGAQATFSKSTARNSVEVGIYGFQQHDDELFGLLFNDGSAENFVLQQQPSGHQVALFAQDKFRATSWLTLTGGVRQTHFSGEVVEDATSPRVGASVRVPVVDWTIRGFYGRFYQAPPLLTASGPLLDFVTDQNLGFIPLHGERDEEYQVGVVIPLRAWTIDGDRFQTRATNFFDHNVVGNSNVFFPLTIDRALIRGWELTLRSPRTWRHAQVHVAYSHQHAEGSGAITGGLTDFSPPADAFLLDHDQAHTLSAGFNATLAGAVIVAANVYYGSGFADEGGPAHLPGHTTADVSVGRSLGKTFTVTLNVLNLTDNHVLLDNSLTFGGTHYNNPREIYVEARYRFRY
jgi:TonB dependent receptor/Carboxypeptidase regulatory-like domain/TonB-dependent Receptor Plug Domain